MSLINQMLRDLEARRKADTPQLSANEVLPPTVTRGSGSRWIRLALLGSALGGLVWFGLKVLPDRSEESVAKITRPAEPEIANISADKMVSPAPAILLRKKGQVQPGSHPIEQSQVALVVKPDEPPATVTSPVVSDRKQAEAVVVEKAVARPQVTETSPSVGAPVKKTVQVAPAAPPAKLHLGSKGGAKNVSLLDIGIVEGIDAVRLMFEFEKLPAYRVHSNGQDATALTVSFFDTGKDTRLEIPPFRGPLLQQLDLEPAKQELRLSLELGKPIKLQAYSLPADGVHGDRLLLELSEDRGAQTAVYTRTQITKGEKLRSRKVPGASNGEDSKEQAEVLYRNGLRYLAQGNDGAAKIQFAKALELTPVNVELRLRLIDLLVTRQQLDRVETLLIAGLALAPGDPQLRTHYGRLLLEHNQVAEALKLMLSKPIPALPDQPDYHALLAALEQENGQFANAATRYRELLKIRPTQADWWLLLAIAYEQLDDVKLARSAYRQALENTGLSTEHRQFSLERLERLQRLQD